jgi:hypothetical protein
MRRFYILTLSLAMISLLNLPSFHSATAQERPRAVEPVKSSIDTTTPADIDRIIRAFTAKETEFRRALNIYAFKRDAVMQDIGMGGQITGEYHRVSTFTFADNGERFEKISFFPMPTMPSVTAEDLEDLGGVNQFALESSKIDQYNFKYVGKEHIDELDLYVFDVTPKVIPDFKKIKERLFTGRIWVDDHDLQIVKTKGKGVPENKDNKFPFFETYREQIDGRFWFPTYAYADEELVFGNGQTLHVRARVRYSDYKMARTDVKIIEGDVIDDSDPKPTPKPTPSPSPSKP